MNNDDLTHAINAINLVQQLFQTPSSREEEELRHLLSAVQQRLQKMYADHTGSPAPQHHAGSSLRREFI